MKCFRPLTLLALVACGSFLAPLSAHEVVYKATLSGANEDPANASPGIGTATVTVDLDLATLRVESAFSGLMGNVTAAHIHCCTVDPGLKNAGVATPVPTFPDFPLGVTAGSYDKTFDLASSTSYNPAFITSNGGTVSGGMNALLAGMDSGRAYLNIHTSSIGSGEIRGFLQVVPEPSSASLMLVGLSVAGLARRRRR